MINKLNKQVFKNGALELSKVLFLVLILVACNKEETQNVDPAVLAKQELIARGKTTYMANCIACHNLNPKLPGGTGPDVHGSSLELLEARVLRASYPPGYKPKRDTGVMPEFEDLKDEIPALHAFLNQ